jgi:hypothetical protein
MPGTASDIPALALQDNTPLSTKPISHQDDSPPMKPRQESTTSKPASTELRQFVNDERHFSLVRNFKLADLVTIMNGVCGSLSVFSCAKYLLTSDRQYLWYASAIAIATGGNAL